MVISLERTIRESREEASGQAPLLYDLATVARLLGVSKSAIARVVAHGQLASCKLGKRRLVSQRQLAAYIERLECGEVA